MSVSSFDFDKFSLSSEDENNGDYEEINIDSISRKNYIYDAELENENNDNDIFSYEYEHNQQTKQNKQNNTDVFLNLLDAYLKLASETEQEEFKKKINLKYMLNISNIDIPKYIIGSRTNKPCANCKINIEQKINNSFVKILEKDYFLCFTCKDKFFININSSIENKFLEMKDNNEFLICTRNIEEFKKFEQLIELQRHNLNKFAYFLEIYMSEDQVKNIINKITDTAYDNIKFNKPYLNIKIYDYDMSDYRFTNMARIKSLLKNKSVSKIDNENYKFTNKEFGNHYEYKAKAENKCICCKTELNLNKFKLAVTAHNVKINHIIKKYENLHYLLYAVCTNCRIICDKIQIDCIKYFIELEKVKNFNEVIDVEIEKNNIIDFLKSYNDKFFELLNTANVSQKN